MEMGAKEDQYSRRSSLIEEVPEIQIGVIFEDEVEDAHPKESLKSYDLDNNERRKPSLHLLEDSEKARKQYLYKGVPLYKSALKNDWRAAKRIICEDKEIVRAAITRAEETALHITAGAKHIEFVKELVDLMDKEDLALQDCKGNTAFCFAALTGSVEIARVMMVKNKDLPLMRGGQRMTPLYMAALFGHPEMSMFLYPMTKKILDQGELFEIFFTCIQSDLYGLALKMFEDNGALAVARDGNNDTGLHILARKPLAFHQSPRVLLKSSTISSLLSSHNKSLMESDQALQLFIGMWKEVLVRLPNLQVKQLINRPSRLLFEAAELGNFGFLAELINSYPDLVWDIDDKKRTIFHIAVLNRHINIFSLIHEIGSIKDVIVTFEDDKNNNILHLAATMPPPHKLNPQLGPALQLQQELLWFKEVEKIMVPSYAEMRNTDGLTPKDVFKKTHASLLKDGERWMRKTSKSCMMVSVLIAIAVFVAASRASSNSERKVFNWPEAIALFSSSISTLTFLSILTTSHTEMEFLGPLPLKLIMGVATLFISMTTMMIAFYGRLLILSYPHGLNWFPNLKFVGASILVGLLVILESLLMLKILYLTFPFGFFFKSIKSMLYK